MNWNHKPKVGAILLAVMCMSRWVSAGILIYVDPRAPGANNGSTWRDAHLCLQNALWRARAGDEIRVARGIYRPDEQTRGTVNVPDRTIRISGNRDDTFALPEGVVIRGGYAGYTHPHPDTRDIDVFASILSGDLGDNDIELTDLQEQTVTRFVLDSTRLDNSRTIVTAASTSSATILDGFTITGGHCEGGSPTNAALATADLVKPDASPRADGAGIFVREGNPTVVRCRFYRNTVQSSSGHVAGGAGAVNKDASATFRDCIFEENVALGPDGISLGAALLNSGGAPQLVNCTFRNNIAAGLDGSYCGGAVATIQSDCEMVGCSFIGNRAIASNGGAIYGGGLGSTTIRDCTFEGNWADRGGALATEQAHHTNLRQCTFLANKAVNVGRGGAVYNGEQCVITMTSCRFSGNSATGQGGAVYGLGALTVINSAFSGNTARGGGGIFYAETEDVVKVVNSTFTANQAAENGGAFHIPEGRVDFFNCILWADTPEEIYPLGGAANVSHSNIQGYPRGINAEPRFQDPLGADGIAGTLDDNLRLSVGSPCLDAGDNASVPSPLTSDLDGLARIIGGRVDMGAYEFDGPLQYYVDAVNGHDSNGGWAPRVAFATIQRGIQAAGNGYTVMVLPGVYTEEVNFAGKAVSVSGGQGGAILEAPDGYAVSFFTAERSGSILENVVIRNSEVGIFIAGARPTIRNVTLAGNEFGITAYAGANPDINNCILWDNVDGDLFGCTATYSCIQQGEEGEGNIREDPLFADPESGDYHLLAEKGRYVPAHGLWSFDERTSPCVDAGNPWLDPGAERRPNGGRINMGAFGGTPEASLSEWPLSGDLSRDGRVDFIDMAILCDQWLEELPMADTAPMPRD